jgi:hypothetical protein
MVCTNGARRRADMIQQFRARISTGKSQSFGELIAGF